MIVKEPEVEPTKIPEATKPPKPPRQVSRSPKPTKARARAEAEIKQQAKTSSKPKYAPPTPPGKPKTPMTPAPKTVPGPTPDTTQPKPVPMKAPVTIPINNPAQAKPTDLPTRSKEAPPKKQTVQPNTGPAVPLNPPAPTEDGTLKTPKKKGKRKLKSKRIKEVPIVIETAEEKTVKGPSKPDAKSNAFDILRNTYRSKKRSTRAKKVPVHFQIASPSRKREFDGQINEEIKRRGSIRGIDIGDLLVS